jgi:hypothetical protein
MNSMRTQLAPRDSADRATRTRETGYEFVTLAGENYICIRHVDRLSPFLMSIVSDSDHWLYVGSNAPFTAGRVDADHALFPYQTVDKILRHADSSGALTVLLVNRGDQWLLWEPWRDGRAYPISRHLYKHVYGTGVIFEEVNDEFGLCFRWSLTACEPYGFVRECWLENLRPEPVAVRYLDGWHQILPPGVSQDTFAQFSYLAAAYMRHESLPESELALYTLNAGISDRPEAYESLRAACAWSLGHARPAILLSDRQVESFRRGAPVHPESEARGEVGAYLVADSTVVTANRPHSWITVADTGLDHAAIVRLQTELGDPAQLTRSVRTAIEQNRAGLRRRIAAADGLQDTADQAASVHHFANVLFNCMRGGTFNDSYRFPAADFREFVQARNRDVLGRHAQWLDALPPSRTLAELRREVATRGDGQLTRLAHEYLPLTFSRRHGDPSRPWNRFSIRIKDEHGNPDSAYQGNWRDIFQNWESLGQSYPMFLEQMITVFLNASTADGYNPYRISRAGIDWEVRDALHPWGHIGYWGDHQIIYLLRLMESYDRFQPGRLAASLNHTAYSYARVPYEINGFEQLVVDPRNSVTFDQPLHERLMARAEKLGGDGKLLTDDRGDVLLVSLAEKLLVPLLVKLSNLVPGGGIWLNTQRPEWNDANNALAGWGLSMITVYHIRRYLTFLDRLLATGPAAFDMSAPVVKLLADITRILRQAGKQPEQVPDDAARFHVMAKLGRAGADHRQTIYRQGVDGRVSVPLTAVRDLIAAALPVIDASIRASRRADGLYQSYNVLRIDGARAVVQNLDPMLEGQVAALDSGGITPAEAVALLQALRNSDLYQAERRSYLLYPDRPCPSFLARNTLPGPPPLPDRSLFVQDNLGQWHFQADLRNAADVNARLDKLGADPPARKAVVDLWEATFHHSQFTGRSSTFFAFEGLGSIYWHMVAKLLLAVQECHHRADNPKIAHQLAEAYDDIRDGLGFRKTPQAYGAFPTDPYSHSPRHRGAQQPGMTGQVKEEILTRWGELGIRVENGCLSFAPRLLHRSEFFTGPHRFSYRDVRGQEQTWDLPADSLGFTYCQTPVCYRLADTARIVIERPNGSPETVPTNELDAATSASIFLRDGRVSRLTVFVPVADLRGEAGT